VNDQYLRMELNPMYDSLSHPEQLFFRSDHYSFVSKGIPAVFFFTGLHADYHQVTDYGGEDRLREDGAGGAHSVRAGVGAGGRA
jgi:hypothetical protein